MLSLPSERLSGARRSGLSTSACMKLSFPLKSYIKVFSLVSNQVSLAWITYRLFSLAEGSNFGINVFFMHSDIFHTIGSRVSSFKPALFTQLWWSSFPFLFAKVFRRTILTQIKSLGSMAWCLASIS